MNPKQTLPGRRRRAGSHAVILGTRGSELALAQAQLVAEALRKECGVEIETEVVRTSGDESAKTFDRRAGRKGLFTAELERALMANQIDLAVHSAKDLGSELLSGTKIAAALTRGAIEDVLITRLPERIEQLPTGATVATGSIRRQRQVRWLRADLKVIDLRGNVPTRLRKFAASNWEAIVLARAGLERLGFSSTEFELAGAKFFSQVLPLDRFLPAGGQAIIALQSRADDAGMLEMASTVDDAETHLCLRAEREFLRLLQGDCDLPVGVLATVVDGEIELRAQLFGEAMTPKCANSRGAFPEALAADVFSKINAG